MWEIEVLLIDEEKCDISETLRFCPKVWPKQKAGKENVFSVPELPRGDHRFESSVKESIVCNERTLSGDQ